MRKGKDGRERNEGREEERQDGWTSPIFETWLRLWPEVPF